MWLRPGTATMGRRGLSAWAGQQREGGSGVMETNSMLEATSANLRFPLSAAHSALPHFCPFLLPPPKELKAQASGGYAQGTRGL